MVPWARDLDERYHIPIVVEITADYLHLVFNSPGQRHEYDYKCMCLFVS